VLLATQVDGKHASAASATAASWNLIGTKVLSTPSAAQQNQKWQATVQLLTKRDSPSRDPSGICLSATAAEANFQLGLPVSCISSCSCIRAYRRCGADSTIWHLAQLRPSKQRAVGKQSLCAALLLSGPFHVVEGPCSCSHARAWAARAGSNCVCSNRTSGGFCQQALGLGGCVLHPLQHPVCADLLPEQVRHPSCTGLCLQVA